MISARMKFKTRIPGSIRTEQRSLIDDEIPVTELPDAQLSENALGQEDPGMDGVTSRGT